MKRQYTPKIDALLEHATALGFTEQDFADLALAAADQSGADGEEQHQLARILGVEPYVMRPVLPVVVVTADTITDERIRELQRSVAGHAFPAAGMAHTELSEVWEVCNDALALIPESGDVHAELLLGHRERARARCAEIWNERAAGRAADRAAGKAGS